MRIEKLILSNLRSYKDKIEIDKNDVNKQAVADSNTEIIIGVVFGNLPAELTIDATNPTTLENECLLNRDGNRYTVPRNRILSGSGGSFSIFTTPVAENVKACPTPAH